MSIDTAKPQEAGSSQQQSDVIKKAASSSQASTKTSSKMDMDVPAQLDACVQSTFLLALKVNTEQSTVRYTNAIREQVIGSATLIKYIDEGYSPEMLGTVLDNTKAVERAIKEKEGDICDLALGFTVVQIATQYDVVSIRDNPSIDAVRLSRLEKTAKKTEEQDTNEMKFPMIDHRAIYTHVEEEKINGNLAGDPAWELEKSRRKTLGWRDSLQINLKRLDLGFQELVRKTNWDNVRSNDEKIAKDITVSDLIATILKTYEEVPARLISGPIQTGCDSSELSTESFCRAGKHFRSAVLQVHKNQANKVFQMAQYERAEGFYKDAIEAGSNDPSVPLNRAAALLKLDRYEEAIMSCSLALMQLDICGQGKNSTLTNRSIIHFNERTEVVMVSSAELSNLRWKAHIRRGRAQKAMIEAFGSRKLNDSERQRLEALLQGAQADFKIALRIDPHNDTPKQELAALLLLQKRDAAANQTSSQDLASGIASINITS